MDYYRTFFRFEDDGGSKEPFDSFGREPWEHRGQQYRDPGLWWSMAGGKAIRVLPWIGGFAIGLGLLIIIFPMLLVIAVAGLFFMVGAACLSMWLRMREQIPQSHRVRIGAPWWERLKKWLQERLG